MRATVYPRGVTIVQIDGVNERVDVGRLVLIKAPSKYRRDIEPADAVDAAHRVVALLVGRGVDVVALEQNTGDGAYAERGRLIGSAIETACRDAGIAIETFETATHPKEERSIAPIVPLPELPPAAIETSRELAAELAGELAPAAAPPHGPRVAGIDPGSHWIAVTVAEGTTAPLGYVASRVFDVGRLVPLAKPKVTRRKDGTERIQTHRRVIEDVDVDALLADVVGYLDRLDVAHVVVERATHFYGGAAADQARAAGLARAQWIGGELAGALRAGELKVETVSSRVWRGVAKKRGPTWRDGVLTSITGWPPSLPGEHAIDAAGLCLYAVAKPAPSKPRASGPKAKRVRVRSGKDSHAARDAKRAKARAAIGCTCKARRGHSIGCPARMPA